MFALICTLSACGGGSTETAAPAPPPATAPVLNGPVVFVGDSLTEFWETGPFTVPDPKLSQLVPGEINAGASGDRTDQMLARFSTVLEKHPSVVVILGGTNDIRQVEFPTTDNIAAMADRAAASGARVILCTLPPASVTLYPASVSPTDAINDARIRKFNTELRALAAGFGYSVADYYSALVNTDGSQNTSLFVTTDLIHPSTSGYRAIWSVLRPKLVGVGVQGVAP